MAEETSVKPETKTDDGLVEPRRVIYYTFDPDGRIRHTVCLQRIEIPKEHQVQDGPATLYAKGVTYLSNEDYKNDIFSIRAAVGIAQQRAEKVAKWFASCAYGLEVYIHTTYGYGCQGFFGKGKGKINADKMQLLTKDELTDRDWSELGLERILQSAQPTPEAQARVSGAQLPIVLPDSTQNPDEGYGH